MTHHIFPSILDADPKILNDLLRMFEMQHLKGIHIDIMDGNYVPSFGFNERFVKWLSRETNLYLDLHLMVSSPEKYVDKFVEAGASAITVHSDCNEDLYYLITKINSLGIDSGIALNPGFSPESIKYLLPLIRRVLVMTTCPGRVGQNISIMSQKVNWLDKKRKNGNLNYRIAVDGGITSSNIQTFMCANCDDFVSGSYIVKSKTPRENLKKLLRVTDNG
ncbi:ribulose-phosphate 3-epimerase [Pediococcus parvulus]|uniref:ribulose-phosphate 3-epimerase n=1 Tax=Pediococcus parvulus TaxID=54062 RepID=UPI00345E3BC3